LKVTLATEGAGILTGRLRLALAGLLVVAVAVASYSIWQARQTGGRGEAGVYAVSVVGPDGAWWNGTVEVGDGATVLDATRAAAAGNFSLDVEQQALGAYVRGIGPYHETFTGGWNYCIDGGTGLGYAWVGIAADQRPLRHGERIQWRWAEGGSEVC